MPLDVVFSAQNLSAKIAHATRIWVVSLECVGRMCDPTMLVHVFGSRKSFACFTPRTGFKFTQDMLDVVQVVLPTRYNK